MANQRCQTRNLKILKHISWKTEKLLKKRKSSDHFFRGLGGLSIHFRQSLQISLMFQCPSCLDFSYNSPIFSFVNNFPVHKAHYGAQMYVMSYVCSYLHYFLFCFVLCLSYLSGIIINADKHRCDCVGTKMYRNKKEQERKTGKGLECTNSTIFPSLI